METCVISTLLYGAENWVLDESCLELLENFQAEIGRRILKLSKYHSSLVYCPHPNFLQTIQLAKTSCIPLK